MEIPVFIAIGSSLLTGLIGLLVGHRLAIGRDRRREFNVLVDPVRDLVLCQKIPDRIQILKIRERLTRRKRKGFDRAIEVYKQSKSTYTRNRKPDGMGGFLDGDKSAEDRLVISHAVNDLLRYLKPR